jgi:predicted DNA-binding transcriptional regulator YafY
MTRGPSCISTRGRAMRGDQLARQWKILKLMESRRSGISVSEIAFRLPAPPRNIYRDLDALQQAGFPLYTDKIENTQYWRLLDTSKAGIPMPLDLTEIISLHIGKDLLQLFEGTVIYDSIESLLTKIKSCLSPSMMNYFSAMNDALAFGTIRQKKYGTFKEILARITDAATRKNSIEIHYKAASTRKETARKVDPYKIGIFSGNFYLIGYCHLRKTVRTFSIDRISDAQLTEDTFEIPKDFSIEDYMQTAFRVMTGKPERVQILFSQKAAEVVKEKIWHPSQEIRELSDGRVLISLQVAVNYEIQSWIMGFGSTAQVIEPKQLRQKITEDMKAALENYRSEKILTEGSKKRKPVEVATVLTSAL